LSTLSQKSSSPKYPCTKAARSLKELFLKIFHAIRPSSLRALCRTENFKALRPVNLEKAVRALRMGNNGKNFIKYLKLPIRILSVLYPILKSIMLYASGSQGLF
jgi:hypothetical protein